MDEALKDERFSHILKDPRFRKIPKNVRKIKVDKRFTNMFNDRDFNEKSKKDERGRALNLTSVENLKKLYNVTNDSSEDESLDQNVTSYKESSSVIVSKEIQEESLVDNKQVNKKKNKKVKKKSYGKELESHELREKEDNTVKITENVRKNKMAEVTPKSLKQTVKQAKTGKQTSQKAREIPCESDTSEDEGESIENGVKSSKSQIKVKDLKKDKSKSSGNGINLLNRYRQEQVNEVSDEDESDSSDEESEESEDSHLEDSDDSSSDESSFHNEEEFDHHWEELHEEAEDTDQITRRLAVCNMDWDRIRADDLFVVFNSFKPADSSILSVKIYPSEFGLQRMEEEKLCGPPELVEKTLESDEEEIEDKKGSKYNREKLRQYQINRLRYFYAVVECDTPETADHLYDQLNGMEYESSSVRFDLRFIPDDTTFDQEPTSVAEKIPDPAEYKPRLFVTTALQQVKVNLTWDETDPQRKETLHKAFTDPNSIERDIKDYLASSSDESEVEDDEDADEDGGKLSTKDRIAKYRALLQSVEEKEKASDEKYEMEITWDPSLKEKTEEMVKGKLEDTSNPFEEMLRKKKEDRKLKKQKKKLNKSKENEDSSVSEESDSDFASDDKSAKQSIKQDTKRIDELYLLSDAKKIDKPQEKNKSKRRKYKKPKNEVHTDEFKCDITDPRFSAIYSSHDYNIDPSDPHFKKTDGALAIIQEKQKRLLKDTDVPLTEERKTKKMRHR